MPEATIRRPLKALITSLHFTGLTGSEIVALEVAEALMQRGVDVSVYSYAYSKGYLDYLKSIDIKPLGDIPSLWGYDLVWSQHGIWCRLLAELALPEGPEALLPLILPVSLSPYEEIERIPSNVARRMGLTCWVNSEETAQVETQRLGMQCAIKVFYNAAPSTFLKARNEETASEGNKSTPRREVRALVVSNHPPQELIEALIMLCERESGGETRFSVDFAGLHGEHNRISATTLKKYDFVLTIGKTVQYCICLGIPIYIYDCHGGPGWLTEDIYDKALFFNFSGRPWPSKSSMQILSELMEYPPLVNAQYKSRLVRDVCNRFSLAPCIEQLLQSAKDTCLRSLSQDKLVNALINDPEFGPMLHEFGRLHSYIHRLQPLALSAMEASSLRKLVLSSEQLRIS